MHAQAMAFYNDPRNCIFYFNFTKSTSNTLLSFIMIKNSLNHYELRHLATERHRVEDDESQRKKEIKLT